MTKDEHIAKLSQALERICTVTLPVTEAHDVATEALALPSSSEPSQPGEITDEMVERACTAYDLACRPAEPVDLRGSSWKAEWPGDFEWMRAALEAALGETP